MASPVLEAFEPLVQAVKIARTDIVVNILTEVKKSIEKELDTKDAGLVQERFVQFVNSERPELDGANILRYATQLGNKHVVLALLQMGASDPAGPKSLVQGLDDDMKQTFILAIIHAMTNGDTLLVKNLLMTGVNVNAVDDSKTKMSLLHWACCFPNVDIIRILLEHGADVNLQDAKGATPLHEALKLDNCEKIVALLIEHGADLYIAIETGPAKGQRPIDLIEKNPALSSASLLKLAQKPNLANGSASPEDIITNNSNSVDAGVVSQTVECTQIAHLSVRDSAYEPNLVTEFVRLTPVPQSVRQLRSESALPFPGVFSVSISAAQAMFHDAYNVINLQKHRFSSLGIRFLLNDNPVLTQVPQSTDETSLHVFIRTGLYPASGSYKLVIDKNGVVVSAGDIQGVHYAICTLLQILIQFAPSDKLEAVQIDDFPSSGCVIRGLLLDLNPHGRVLDPNELMQVIDTMAFLKMNQLQLFVRLLPDTAPYPYMKRVIVMLEKMCRDRFIELVPALDIGQTPTASDVLSHFSIVSDVLDMFVKPRVLHIGPLLTKCIFGCDQNELPLQPIREFLLSKVDTLMICGNALPEGLRQLHYKVLPLQYGFQRRSFHSESVSRYGSACLPFGICTGTAAWSSISGSPSCMMTHMYEAHQALASNHGQVSLVAHWCGEPTFTHFACAWPGILAAACLAWNPNVPPKELYATLDYRLNNFVLHRQLARACKVLLDLGRAEHFKLNSIFDEKLEDDVLLTPDQSSIFMAILKAPLDAHKLTVDMTQFYQAMNVIRNAHNELQTNYEEGVAVDKSVEGLKQEIYLTSELLLLAAKIGRCIWAAPASPSSPARSARRIDSLPSTTKTDFANKLLALIRHYRDLWSSRYMKTGLLSSLMYLKRLFDIFAPEGSNVNEAMPLELRD